MFSELPLDDSCATIKIHFFLKNKTNLNFICLLGKSLESSFHSKRRQSECTDLSAGRARGGFEHFVLLSDQFRLKAMLPRYFRCLHVFQAPQQRRLHNKLSYQPKSRVHTSNSLEILYIFSSRCCDASKSRRNFLSRGQKQINLNFFWHSSQCSLGERCMEQLSRERAVWWDFSSHKYASLICRLAYFGCGRCSGI